MIILQDTWTLQFVN